MTNGQDGPTTHRRRRPAWRWLITIGILLQTAAFAIMGASLGYGIAKLYGNAARELLISLGFSSGFITLSALIDKWRDVRDIIVAVWRDMCGRRHHHVLADCAKVGALFLIAAVGLRGGYQGYQGVRNVKPAPETHLNNVIIWNLLGLSDTTVLELRDSSVRYDLDSIVSMLARFPSRDSAPRLQAPFPAIFFPNAGPVDSRLGFEQGVRPSADDSSTIRRFAHALEACVVTSASSHVEVTVVGYASSDTFHRVDPATSRTLNVRAANLRAATTDSVMREAWRADGIDSSRINAAAHVWTDFNSMVTQRPYIDDPLTARGSATRIKLDPGQLNRRAEVIVDDAGSCDRRGGRLGHGDSLRIAAR